MASEPLIAKLGNPREEKSVPNRRSGVTVGSGLIVDRVRFLSDSSRRN